MAGQDLKVGFGCVTQHDHEKEQNLFTSFLFLSELDGAWIAGKGFNLLLGHVWDPWDKAKGVGCASIYFC